MVVDASVAAELVAVVVVFSVVQSVFGVGLLVFGTPTLLLLGFPFAEVLIYLLPCSLVISSLQILGSGLTLEPIRKRFLLTTAPATVVGAVIVLAVLDGTLRIRVLVGAMLLLTALIRLLEPARDRMGELISRQQNALFTLLGLLHGLTNLGGGVLTLIVSSLYQRKEDVRRHVAFAYALMAGVQLCTLLATTALHARLGLVLALPVLAGLTFALLGQRAFRAAGQLTYQWGLTGLLVILGVLLIAT